MIAMSEKNARKMAVSLQSICRIVVMVAFLVGVLVLLGRVQMTLHTPEGTFENALMLEKDHSATSRFLFATISANPIFLKTDGTVGFITWLGVALIGITRVFPLGFACYMLSKFFGNIADGQVFVKENADILKKAGFVLVVMAIVAPFLNGLLIPALVNSLSSNRLILSMPVAFTEILFGFALMVMAYVFSYGLYLQDEVDHTL